MEKNIKINITKQCLNFEVLNLEKFLISRVFLTAKCEKKIRNVRKEIIIINWICVRWSSENPGIAISKAD
jgi:hypothetical protein